jgi:hypothetical protein
MGWRLLFEIAYLMPIPITPAMSLNRVKIVDLPGLDIPDHIRGKVSGQLVSSPVLTELIRRHSADLQLDSDLRDHELHLAFDQSLISGVASVRSAAESIAQHIGSTMGYILLALKRGDEVIHNAREDWNFAYWDHWAQINRVWLGGGLIGSGNLGPYYSICASGGRRGYSVTLSMYHPYGADLLSSARRAMFHGNTAAIVLDFGSTLVKRACAMYADDHLIGLRRLRSVPLSWAEGDTLEQAKALIDQMVFIIVQTWAEAKILQRVFAPVIPVSVAAYIKNGQPMITQGGNYYKTIRATDNLQAELSRRVSESIHEPASIMLIHDGTAAARYERATWRLSHWGRHWVAPPEDSILPTVTLKLADA